MKSDIQNRLKTKLEEKVLNRKAMFIPMLGVAVFMLVGYAGVDREKPEILSSHIEIPYGEEFVSDMIDVIDNHDDRDEILVEANTNSLNVNQLGSYRVEVRATDRFNNVDVKSVLVDVVDHEAPKLEILGANSGYYIEVPIYGSQDMSSYLKATDNVDGDVTPFIETNKPLDTSTQGIQTIEVSVSDNNGNITKEEIEFFVADMQAPEITLLDGKDVLVDYASDFDWHKYMTITDNLDSDIEPVIEGKINTKKLDEKKEITVIATDGAGNSSKVTLNATVKDITGPNIVLSKTKLAIDKGTTLDLKSYLVSAIDNQDGDMKNKITFNTIDTSTTGDKVVTYSGVDKSGNKSSVNLVVEVSSPGDRIVKTGYTKLGCRYVWGATGPNTFDCSGFTQWVYRQNGIYIPRSSGAQKAGAKKVVSVSQAQVGDILWRNGHVGIYIGGGRYIHAPHTGDVVKISSGIGSFKYALRY